MQVHAKRRAFDDPGTLGLRASAWKVWHLRAPQWVRGRVAKGRPVSSRVKADPVELARVLAELEAS